MSMEETLYYRVRKYGVQTGRRDIETNGTGLLTVQGWEYEGVEYFEVRLHGWLLAFGENKWRDE